MLKEQEVLQKWGNGATNGKHTALDIFHLSKDIMIARRGENGWRRKAVELQAPPDSEYDYLVLKSDSPVRKSRQGIWIHSLERAATLSHEHEVSDSDDRITSSFLFEQTVRRGREKVQLYIPPIPFYAPLTGSNIGENKLYGLELNQDELSILFRGVRAAFFRTVLEEISPSQQSTA